MIRLQSERPSIQEAVEAFDCKDQGQSLPVQLAVVSFSLVQGAGCVGYWAYSLCRDLGEKGAEAIRAGIS